MPQPFPGMDPYLEDPADWPDVHHELISTIRELLNKELLPKYVARVEQRVYMSAEEEPEDESQRVPDVRIDHRSGSTAVRQAGARGLAIAEPVLMPRQDPIRERRVEIVSVPGRKVVTVIELLSPANKRASSPGRKSFLDKRDEVLNSDANWVEIDLLREGIPHPTKRRFPNCQYLVFSAPTDWRSGKVWPLYLQEPLKVVGIPLRGKDPDAPLDLQAALNLAYDRAAYDATIDYTKPPVPPLPPALARWANKLLKQKKLR
jgi:hypothetical protein